MKEFRYNNATIRIAGEVNREKIEEATIIFMKKVQRSRKKNDNNDQTRTITKKQILD